MDTIESSLSLEELEQLMGIATAFAPKATAENITKFLNALRSHFDTGCAAIVQLERGQPASLIGLTGVSGEGCDADALSQRLSFVRESISVDQHLHVNATADTLISAYSVQPKIASALILRVPSAPFQRKDAISIRLVHSLIQAKLASIHQPTSADVEMPPRVQQVRQGLLDGLSDKQIASRLRISPHTVHVYVKSVFKSSGVHSRAELLSGYIKSPPNTR